MLIRAVQIHLIAHALVRLVSGLGHPLADQSIPRLTVLGRIDLHVSDSEEAARNGHRPDVSLRLRPLGNSNAGIGSESVDRRDVRVVVVDRENLGLGEAKESAWSGPAHQSLKRLANLVVSTNVADVRDVKLGELANVNAE